MARSMSVPRIIPSGRARIGCDARASALRSPATRRGRRWRSLRGRPVRGRVRRSTLRGRRSWRGPKARDTPFEVLGRRAADSLPARSTATGTTPGARASILPARRSRKDIDELAISETPCGGSALQAVRGVPRAPRSVPAHSGADPRARGGRLGHSGQHPGFHSFSAGGEPWGALKPAPGDAPCVIDRDVVATAPPSIARRALLRVDSRRACAPAQRGRIFALCLPTGGISTQVALHVQRQRGGVAGIWGKLPPKRATMISGRRSADRLMHHGASSNREPDYCARTNVW